MFIETRPTPEEINRLVVTPEQWADALGYYHEHKNELIQAAAFSRRNAVSHRDPPFQVGAAAMAIEPRLPNGEYGIYQAYNSTPTPGNRKGAEKRCAERGALEAAAAWAKVVAAIATISKEIHTGDPTKAHDALHPCKECRIMYREQLQKGLLREGTIVCNANDAGEQIVTEERTLKELLDLYLDDVE